jgi:3-isopropylmalate dehydrogenase
MAANKKLLVLPGDGIGPEVMREVLRVVDWMAKHRAVGFDLQEGLVGGAAFDAHGTPLTDETMADAAPLMRSCLGLLAGRNTTACRLSKSPSAGFCNYAKKWTFLPICGQPSYLMQWLTPRP